MNSPRDDTKGLDDLTPFEERSASYEMGFTDGLMWMADKDPLKRGPGGDFTNELIVRMTTLWEKHGASPARWSEECNKRDLFSEILNIMDDLVDADPPVN